MLKNPFSWSLTFKEEGCAVQLLINTFNYWNMSILFEGQGLTEEILPLDPLTSAILFPVLGGIKFVISSWYVFTLYTRNVLQSTSYIPALNHCQLFLVLQPGNNGPIKASPVWLDNHCNKYFKHCCTSIINIRFHCYFSTATKENIAVY